MRLGIAAGLCAAAALGACAHPVGPLARSSKAVPAPVPSSLRCEDVTFPIYFKTGSESLTEPAIEAIKTTAARTKGCPVIQVMVIGLADAEGGAKANLDLSRKRAEAAAAVLLAQGYPAPALTMDAEGAQGARRGGAIIPSRRRSEVTIRFAH